MKAASESRPTALWRHVREYRAFLVWLISDLRPFRGAITMANVNAILGLLGQLGSLGLLYWYLPLMHNNEVLVLAGFTIGRAAEALPFSVTVLAFSALTLSAVLLEFHGRSEAINLTTKYSDFCEKRAYVLYSRIDHALVHDPSLASGKATLHLLLREAKMAGRAARLLTIGLFNIAAFPIGIGVLLWLDAGLSLIVGCLLLVGLIGYYRISVAVASSRTTGLAMVRDANKERRTLFDRALKCQAPLDWADGELTQFYAAGAIGKLSLSQEQQQKAAARSDLVSNLILGCGLILIFLIGGVSTITNDTGWEALVFFLLVLRQVGSKLEGAMKIIVGLNRLYPGLRTFADLIGRLGDTSQGATPREIPTKSRSGITLKCLDGSLATIHPGDAVTLLQPQAPLRTDIVPLSAQSHSLGEPQRPARFALLSTLPTCSSSSLRQAFCVPADLTSEALKSRLESLGVDVGTDSIPRDLDATFDGQKGGNVTLSPETPFVLNLLQIIDGGCDAVLVDAPSIGILNASLVRAVFSAAQQTGLVIILVGARPYNGIPGLISQVLFREGDYVMAALPRSEYHSSNPLVQRIDRARRRAREGAVPEHDEEFL